MKVKTAVRRYLRHLEVANRTERTIETEAQRLKRFVEYLAEADVEAVEGLSRDLARDYPEHLAEAVTARGEPLRATTRTNLLIATRNWLRWLHREDLLAVDLSVVVTLPKTGEPLPKQVIEPKTMKKLLAAPDVTTPLGYRDRVILEVLYTSGMRVSELTGLRVRDLDLDEGLVTIRKAKGRRDRVVPLGTIAVEWIEGYLKEARPKLVGDGDEDGDADTLFLTGTGKPMGRRDVAQRIERWVRRAGIRQHVTPHCFRVTVATEMLRRGAGIRHVQELLGHRSVETLSPYLKLTVGDLREAHGRYHPRS